MSYLIVAIIVFVVGFIPYLRYESKKINVKYYEFMDWILLVLVWASICILFPLLFITLIAIYICNKTKVCEK